MDLFAYLIELAKTHGVVHLGQTGRTSEDPREKEEIFILAYAGKNIRGTEHELRELLQITLGEAYIEKQKGVVNV